MSCIVLGLGADPRMFTGLSKGSGCGAPAAEEPILRYQAQSLEDANPLRFFGYLFDFLDLLDFLSVFF
jgi:hypothetical protein